MLFISVCAKRLSAFRKFIWSDYQPERHYMRGPGPACAKRQLQGWPATDRGKPLNASHPSAGLPRLSRLFGTAAPSGGQPRRSGAGPVSRKGLDQAPGRKLGAAVLKRGIAPFRGPCAAL